ncbi:MAG TPA: hypothetical protein VF591_24880 [Pyrinomonadaceae bacterium]|jgi:hypothetical protein
MRILTAFALTICFACAAFAQTGSSNNATQLGTKLVGNVSGNVSAQAVLIPRVNARRIFGDEIANNYAVVEVNISNKSPDAALIIHGIFIDYSNWPLSGMSKNDLEAHERGMSQGPHAEYQGSNRPSQVASVEYRVARGQLLDAQMWTKRNFILRALTLVGSLASAYTFSLKETGIIKGITQASGVGIPGLATAWPDSTVDQLNRVSDFGYRANRVVAREGAEVVVCFFPIDRFLTPGFRKLFLKSPALFFAPLQMLADRQSQNDVKAALGDLNLDVDMEVLRKKLPCYLKIVREIEPVGAQTSQQRTLDLIGQASLRQCMSAFGLVDGRDAQGARVVTVGQGKEEEFKAYMALDYLKSVSLNNVGVTVDGVMSVDTTGIAAKPDGIEFDQVSDCAGGPETECFWTNTQADDGVRTGRITGSYLTAGSVSFRETEGLEFKEFETVAEGATDQSLGFSFKLTKFIPTGTKIHYKVSKANPAGGNTLDSPEREYVVKYTPGPPVMDNPEVSGDNKTVTIGGTGFIPGATDVTLYTSDGQRLEGTDVKLKSPVTPTKVELDMEGKDLGCWGVEVYVGNPPVLATPGGGVFALLPAPTVDDAQVKAKKIVVTGKQLIDTGKCKGKALTFRLEKKEPAVEDKPIPLTPDVKLAEKWEFKLPTEATAADSGPWVIQAWHGAKKLGEPVELKRP